MRNGFILYSLLIGFTSFAQELPSPEPLDARTLAKTIRDSIVVITQFDRNEAEGGVGSGFVVSEDGLIATNLHVIGEGRPITVKLASGETKKVTQIHAWDRILDLAILKIEHSDLVALPLGNSDVLEQGASVVAMGAPHGLEYSIVQGVVSARRDLEGIEMIQLAMPIEPGNSGGPLLDLHGRIHGILSMKSLVTNNLGFAIPVNLLKPLLDHPNPVAADRWLTIDALDPTEWETVFGGHWRQKGGRIIVDEPGRVFGGRALCLAKLEVPSPPYEIAVSVKLGDESGAAGLTFASDGNTHHYGFYPTAGQMRLTRFEGSSVFQWTILDQKQTTHYFPGSWNRLHVRVELDRILCHVNGKLVFESRDKVLTGGRVGLSKFRDTRAEFKDFDLGTSLGERTLELPWDLKELLSATSLDVSGMSDKSLQDLNPHADETHRFLQQRARILEEEAALVRLAAQRLQQRLATAELVALFEKTEDEIDLFHATLLVAKIDDPELDIAHYQKRLETIAGEIRGQVSKDVDENLKIDALITYLFKENGFHGSRHDYYHRANSYMNRVLDDREGLPITLSVLFMELARKAELGQVDGVGLPGHFLVRQAINDQLIDPFNSGKKLSREDAAALVLSSSGLPFQEDFLALATKREIILRMLRNLLGVSQQDEEGPALLRYLDPMVGLAPNNPFHRMNRALLRIQSGYTKGASEDLEWLLQNKPAGIDLGKVTELYHSIQ